MKRFTALFLLAAPQLFGAYTLTTIDQAWVDDFEANHSSRSFTILDSSEGSPETRMTVVWDMDQFLEPSDEGKSFKEVTAGPEWRRTTYGLFTIESGPTFVEADETYLMIEQDPDGRLGIKREVRSGQKVPQTGTYFTLTANEPPPNGGYQHAAVSMDMYIPASFDFMTVTGKFGIGLNAGNRGANGGSVPPDDQNGASTRTVRGNEAQKYHRPYTYALNRTTPHGYQEAGASDDCPVPQGEWVRFELEVFINDLGSDNGYVKLWLNGVKFSEYTGLRFRTADQPFLLNSIQFQDMWQAPAVGQTNIPNFTGHYWYSRIRGMLPGLPDDWSADSNDLNFGLQEVSTNTDVDIEFTNTSGGPLTGNVTLSGSGSGHFSVQSGGSFASLADGAAHTATIRYTPTTNARHDAQVDISGGDGMSVPITGIAATKQAGLGPFNADLGTLIAPMSDEGTYISTDTDNDGIAVYAVDIATAGIYRIDTTVNAPSISDNSFFVDVNDVDLDFTDIWDISALTTGFESRLMSVRGTGTPTVPQHSPATFNLNAGTNFILIKGRENGTQLQDITLTLLGVSDFRKKRISRSPASLGFFQ